MFNRRRLLKASAFCFASSALPAAASSASTDDLVVRTGEGAVSGVEVSDGIMFLGIPYAAAPIGPLRFRPPQSAPQRETTLRAATFAAAAIQADPPNGFYGRGEMPISEDCLYLNIWRPHSAGPHPVFVWIHGGGNVVGSTRMPVIDGARFARHGIVCVSVAYRLGAFGFLDLGEMLGADYAGSGNHGLLDIVAALRWIRRNIAGFGGNPEAVTVGGQSAGAKNVCTLMAMPAARGLFRAVVVQSGGAETSATPDRAADMARQFLAETGESDPWALVKLDARALLAAQISFTKRWNRKYPFRSVIDGIHLPRLPLGALRNGSAYQTPLLIGTTRDESALFGPNAAMDGTVKQTDLANMSLDQFARVYREYHRALPAISVIDRRYAALTAEEYWVPTARAAAAHASAGNATWVYRLDLPRRHAPHAGYAVHGSELPLVWDKVDDPLSSYLGPEGDAGQLLSTTMHAAWVSFIRSGVPAGPDLMWPRYDGAARATMLFGAQSQAVADPDRALRGLWDRADFDFR
jgi:para-nitrobenzyl esterase